MFKHQNKYIVMKTIFHPAAERGHANFGWLDSHHSFSFGQWHNAQKMHFGVLRVLNDDQVKGGAGFGTHPHDNMEIVSIPLSGALAHKDSTGRNEVINTGDVQIMSAGSGISHSEFNASKTDAVNFLQVWLFPKQRDIQPRYDQKTFDAAQRINHWQVVVSPDAKDNGVWINQDAKFSLATIEAGKELSYKNAFSGNGVYFFVLDGKATVADTELNRRDGLGVSDTDRVSIKALNTVSVLAIEVPMQLN
jgi:redox-sensitive bicupin YhaK (pirin superfamily)